jgi:phosphoribosylformylglycinamidine synthase
MDLDVLLGKPPKMHRDVRAARRRCRRSTGAASTLAEARCACCGSGGGDKTFLITIGDRTVGGLCARDQMVGPWQVPVADCAVTLMDFEGVRGEAMAMGERTPLAVIDAAASGRMAVGEAITNLAARAIGRSAREAVGELDGGGRHPGEDAALFDTVRGRGAGACARARRRIPVGKDSLSMRTAERRATRRSWRRCR